MHYKTFHGKLGFEKDVSSHTLEDLNEFVRKYVPLVSLPGLYVETRFLSGRKRVFLVDGGGV